MINVSGFKASEFFVKIDEYLKNTPEAEKTKLISKSKGVYQFDLKADGKTQTWCLDLKQGKLSAEKPAKADITIAMDDTVFVELANGKTTGQKAFMSGKLKAKGNLQLAGKIDTFFTEIRKKGDASPAPAAAKSAAPSSAAPASSPSSGEIEVAGFESSKVFKQIHSWLSSLPKDQRQAQVKKLKGLFQIDVKGKDKVQTWTIDLKNGEGDVHVGAPKSKADAVISIADQDFMSMASGKLNGQKAFMQGKLKVKGQMMLATKLDQVFKSLPSSKL